LSEDASVVVVSFNGSNRHEIIFIFPLFLFSNSCKEKIASGALELTKKAKLERFMCHFLWEWWLPLPSCKVLSSLAMIDNSSFDTYMILTGLCVLVFKKLPQQNHRHNLRDSLSLRLCLWQNAVRIMDAGVRVDCVHHFVQAGLEQG
jgi:hypothetical protein